MKPDTIKTRLIEIKSSGKMGLEIAIGPRVKMSGLGAVRCPRLADRTGIVVGSGGRYSASLRVLFDGNKSAVTLHRDYVEALR
jgi:hypothetical protein